MNHETDITLSYQEILLAGGSDPQWLRDLISEDVISVDGAPESAQYSGFQLARIRRARRICRDFDASVPAVGLIMRLLDEVEELRKSQPAVAIIHEQ